MKTVRLNLERQPDEYEDALDDALEALRDSWRYRPTALIEELRRAFRVAEVPEKKTAA